MKRIVICLVFLFLFAGAINAQTKSISGIVVYHSTGASGNFEIIEVQVGAKKYLVYLFRKDLPSPRTVGNVTQEGNSVRVFYTRIVKSQGYAGELRATKIVEIKSRN
jgi:hypothetical protein